MPWRSVNNSGVQWCARRFVRRRLSLKRHFVLGTAIVVLAISAFSQSPSQTPAYVTPGDNLVIEKIPQIPVGVDDQTHRYGEFRTATLFDWHPSHHEMLIGTRFGDVAQVHRSEEHTSELQSLRHLVCR